MKFQLPLVFTLIWGLLVGTGANAAPRQLISTTVGMVAKHIVTSREVKISHLVEAALFKTKAVKVPMLKYDPGPKFKKEASGVLMEWVVYLESKSFKVKAVPRSEVEMARTQVKERLKDHRGWKQLEVSDRELKDLLKRKLQSKKFIKFRVKSSLIPVTDVEANEYYEANRTQFGNLPFKSFKNNIKAYLRRRQVDRRLKDWFEVLQRKYKVTHFIMET